MTNFVAIKVQNLQMRYEVHQMLNRHIIWFDTISVMI